MSRRRRGTVLLMIVGLLAMLFMIISAYITLARFDRLSLVQADKGAKIEQVLKGVNDVLIGAIAKTWSNNAGDVYFGGARYADVPGGLGMEWLASNNPVRAPSGNAYNAAEPIDYVYPAVTSLAGAATNLKVQSLMFDHPGGAQSGDPQTPNELRVGAGNPNNPDAVYNALRSFMDADGDGIADSLFSSSVTANGVALLTEMANAMDGRAVRTDGVDMTSVSLDDQNASPDTLQARRLRAWWNFQLNARYLAAARVISHGGMASIAVPPTVTTEDDFRVQRMFSWVRVGQNYRTFPSPGTLVSAWSARETIEPLLRMRGGLLLGAQDRFNVPLVLSVLMDDFKGTFVPYQSGNNKRVDSSQRFNLADPDDWDAWRKAACFDAELYGDPQKNFTARQWLTTVNLSDELARDQTTDLPEVAGDLITIRRPGIVAGQPKFYLGKVDQAFVNGTVRFDDYVNRDGYRIVDELAGYYHEMLYDYSINFMASDRLLQAYMLAVNTVAFAAPRDSQGWIDVVYRDYVDAGGAAMRVVGYAPQPFITQAVAYNDPVTTGTGIRPQIALGIELYYPHDPDPAAWSDVALDPPNDGYALNLSQFFITLNDDDPSVGTNWIPLAAVANQRLRGRSFLTVAVNDEGSNTAFDNADGSGYAPNTVSNLAVSTTEIEPEGTTGSPEGIVIKLWRRNIALNVMVLVDKLTLEVPRDGGEKKWIANGVRDTAGMVAGGASWYADGGAGGTQQARWRVAVEDVFAQVAIQEDPDDPDPTFLKLQLWRGELGLAAATGTASAPAVPLYTMNANLGTTLLHGMARPNSFPTVGFLLFVPRYAHVFDGASWKPISERLADEFKKYAGVDSVPCDFGHMPVFDNTQMVSIASDFDNTTGVGQVPWGQFVFDYFTTLNPNGPDNKPNTADDIDIYRVPGRININTASWYVLAGLPVIGPTNGIITGNLPLGGTNACPAFWSTASGVLAGTGLDNQPRRFSVATGERLVWDNVWSMWRLGPELGRAAASYRDGTPYTARDTALLNIAHLRNDPNAPYHVAPGYGTMRSSSKPGFLTIGELANVVGFDSSTTAQLAGLPSVVDTGDFMKAVGLIALLDSSFVTTRSNVFTAYTTLLVLDPEDSQASIRSQVTVDRTNLLPRVVTNASGQPLFEWKDLDGNNNKDPGEIVPMRIQSTGQPEIIGRRQVAYFNTRYED